MFKNLMKFWRGKDFLSGVLEEFNRMLCLSESMFSGVCAKLIYQEQDSDLEEKVFSSDKEINRLQKDIRTKVVEHLSLQPTVDVMACLLLMSVVKDAERLGDYVKNLHKIVNIQEKPFDIGHFEKYFDHVDKEILQLFDDTKKAFMESDEEKAKMSWVVERKIVKKCEMIIGNIAKSDLSVNEAVCFTLVARFFKRLAAHLTNIASSVVLPISDLDYYDEEFRSASVDQAQDQMQ